MVVDSADKQAKSTDGDLDADLSLSGNNITVVVEGPAAVDTRFVVFATVFKTAAI